MLIPISEALVRRCILALEHAARDTAGHSQSPALTYAEDTRQWKDAQYLRRELRHHKQLVKLRRKQEAVY
jgi:hypothetical protein